MRIGIVCPYSWNIPGGVQAHVRDLAETLIGLGHQVSVLAPGDEDTPDLPNHVVLAGKTVPVPYNGSVARVQFGLVSAARVRHWLRDGKFDVVHVHEPAAASLSLLTCMIHDGPLVATFHMATTRSRMLAMFDTMLQPFLEKLSRADRRLHRRPQGHRRTSGRGRRRDSQRNLDRPIPPAEPLAEFAASGQTVGFIGRYDEPRKGMQVLIAALEQLAPSRPNLQLLVAGRGDAEGFRQALPATVRGRVTVLGQVSEPIKASLLRTVDVYCAPNTGQESFGIILLEAMAAGAPDRRE